jgi:hypothetical protein
MSATVPAPSDSGPRHRRGRSAVTETWHTPGCPQYTVDRILLEDGARRVKEQDAWAKSAFPAAHERLQAAATPLAGDATAAPFVAALTQLVQAQADRLERGGGFVGLYEWTFILERHFRPPQSGTERGG